MKRIEVLANFLGCKIEDLIEGYREEVFETKDGKEYLVLTDEEADKEFYNYEESSIEELGLDLFTDWALDLFTDWAKDYIIENCLDTDWFDEYMKESYAIYCDDIELEKSSSDEYENRLEEEMADVDCETKEDYIEYLCGRYENGVEWFQDNFGSSELNHVINDYNLIDIDEVINYIRNTDGRNILASYDGVENEEEEYFIYRIN